MNLEKQIEKLTVEYHGMISSDHHKDRDCHWSIETRWSYGKPPVYVVRHDGYLHSTDEAICDSYAGALAVLRDELQSAIEIERFSKAELEGVRFPDDLPGEMRAFEL